MSSFVTSRERTFTVGTVALTEGQIVKFFTDGTIIAATAGTDVSIGVVSRNAAVGDNVSVVLRNAPGTLKVVASTVIARGAKVTATTGGQAVTTVTNKDEILGVALTAAAAAGDFIEVMPSNGTLSS